jgi:uncharacterized damage-inducible protein DinB
MPASDPLDILLAHDRWATSQILDVCAKLPPDQFRRRFDIGPGSLHDTFTHMAAAMRAWTDTLAGTEPPRPWLEATEQRTPEALRSLLDAAYEDVTIEARRRPLDEIVHRRTRAGGTIVLTRAAALTHVVTHDMHHRAQCLNMLRHLGVSPLPPSSVAEWTWLGDGKA